MFNWNTDIESAPKDRPILIFHDHDTDPYYEDREKGKITIYTCHLESLSLESLSVIYDYIHGCGVYSAVWGGGVDTDESSEGWGPNTLIPDWWFEANSDFRLPLNPVAWAELVLPEGYKIVEEKQHYHDPSIQKVFEKLKPDPVHQDEDGQWHFYDETWLNKYGPYSSEYKARRALQDYLKQLEKSDGRRKESQDTHPL